MLLNRRDMYSKDVILLDRSSALGLWHAMSSTTEELRSDRLAVDSLMAQADRFLGGTSADPGFSLRRAHDGLAQLTTDLKLRLDQVELLWSDVDRINKLTRDISEWRVTDRAAELGFMVKDRRARVLDFMGGDDIATQLVLELMDDGVGFASAVGIVERHLFDLRVAEVQANQGSSLAAAQEYVHHLDFQMAVLAMHGFVGEDAVAGVALAMSLNIDIVEIVDVAATTAAPLVDSIAWIASSRALGVSIQELHALEGLRENLAGLDNPKGGGTDNKVSTSDLRYVVEHPWKFAAPTVVAAQALLDNPELWSRLDTAAHNDDVLANENFGSRDPGDGVVSLNDLEMFMVKSQIHSVLKDYRNQLDIAADGSGDLDGFYSRADFRRFIKDNPQLPDEVLVAADTALQAGWFDRTWFEDHRDELALGAAVLAGGAVILLSGGTATPLVLAAGAAAGGAAAGATALTINLSGDANDAFDDVLANVRNGAVVGFTVAGLPTTIKAVGATSGAARVKAVSLAASDVTALASCGALDIITPEPLEDDLRGAGRVLSAAQGAALGFSVGGNLLESEPNPSAGSLDSLQDGLRAAVNLVGCTEPDPADIETPEWARKAESALRSSNTRSVLDLARTARDFGSSDD